jgi:hypothetical protein
MKTVSVTITGIAEVVDDQDLGEVEEGLRELAASDIGLDNISVRVEE